MKFGHSTPPPKQEEDFEYADDALQDWLLEAADGQGKVRFDLYRMKIPDNGVKAVPHFLRMWENEIPSKAEAGAMFGMGDYYCTVNRTNKGKRDSTSRMWHIDESYGPPRSPLQPGVKESMAKAGMGPTNQPMSSIGSYQAPPVQNDQLTINAMFAQMLAMQQSFMGTLAEIAKGNGSNVKLPDFTTINKALNTVLVDNFKSQNEMLNSVMAERLGAEGEEEETDSVTGIIASGLQWVWENYGQKILKGGKLFQSAAAKEVQKHPMLQEILKHPQQYASAYDKLIQNAPADQVDELLHIVGVPTPTQLQESHDKAAEERGEKVQETADVEAAQ